MSRLPQRGLITTLGLWVCEWLFGSNRRVKVERGQLWSDRNPAALPHYDRLFAHSRSKNFQKFHSRACECPYSHDFGQTQTISSRRNYADKYNNYSNSLLVAVQVFGSESWLCPGSVSLYQNTQWFSVKHQLQDWMDGPGKLGVSQPKPFTYESPTQIQLRRERWIFKEAMTQSMVDALSELCSSFLKGGSSAFIAVIAGGLLPQKNIGHSNNYGPNGPNRYKMGSNY